MNTYGRCVAAKRRKVTPTKCSSTSSSREDASENVVDIQSVNLKRGLNDDCLIEVLVRLPVDVVHRFKCVSKHWLSLISDPYFANNDIKYRSGFLPGCDTHLLFHTGDMYDMVDRISGLSLSDNEDNTSLSIVMAKAIAKTDDRFFTLPLEFIPALQEPHRKELTNYQLWGVSNQLLFLEVGFESLKRRIFYLCNPITKQWTQLPALKPCGSYMFGSVGFTCDPLGGLTVVHIGNYHNFDGNNNIDDDGGGGGNGDRPFFIIQLFSYTSPDDWRVFRVPWPPRYECSEFTAHGKVVFSKGNFYWTVLNGVVAYDPFNKPKECNFIDLPTNFMVNRAVHHVAAMSEGHLRLCCVIEGSFLVWELTLDHNNNYIWSLKYDIHCLPSSYLFYNSFSATNEDKVYFTNEGVDAQTIVLLDLRNASFHNIYKMPPKEKGGGILMSKVMPFNIGSWPTPLQRLQQGNSFDISI